MGKKRIILSTSGGIGDIIAQTVMVRAARKAYPEDEIIVLSTYSYIFDGNPNVDKVISVSKSEELEDFYSKYIDNQDIRFIKKFFPYDHIFDTPATGCKKLAEFITSLFGFKEHYDNNYPDYYTTEYERNLACTLLEQDAKPVVLLQLYGAVPSENGTSKMVCGACGGKGITDKGKCPACNGTGVVIIMQKTNNLKDLDPKLIEPIIKKYSDTYNFCQIGLEGEPLVPGAFNFLGMPFRHTAALFGHPQVKSAILIESSFAHVAASFRKKVVVCFQNTSPDYFGYDSAVNFGDWSECPMGKACNRPASWFWDIMVGYKDPQKRTPTSWMCKNRKCAQFSVDKLEQAFLFSLKESVKEEAKLTGVTTSLEAARKL